MPVGQSDFDTCLQDAVLCKLGRVAARASQVEHVGRLLIKDLANKNYADGLVLTVEHSNMGSIKRCIKDMRKSGLHDRIKSLDGKANDELNCLLQSLGECSAIRDKIIHFCWGPPPAKQVDDALLQEFHEKAALVLNKIEKFRKPRFHSGEPVEVFSAWIA